jgi:hypothetical protein
MKNHDHTVKAKAMLSNAGYRGRFAKGGHVKHEDEAEDKALLKKEIGKAKIKLKKGGCAEGGKPRDRADKLARGGKTKGKGKDGHVTVNVINAHGGQKPPMMMKPPGLPMPPPGAGPGGPPPPGMMPPPGAGGPPPPGMHRGGRAKKAKGGRIDDERDEKPGMPAGHFARGGKTKFPVPMEDGAGGGLGRLAKAKEYGA